MKFRFTIRDVLWLTVLAAMASVGCPAGGFYGNYILINSGKPAIRDLTLSGGGQQRSWPITEPGQGWIADNKGMGVNDRKINVSWKNSAGETVQTQIDFKKATGYRYTGHLIIEIDDGHRFRWRLVSQEDGPVGTFQKLPSTDTTDEAVRG